MKRVLRCPACGSDVEKYRNPFPTVDIIIELTGAGPKPQVVLIQRKNPPLGWALPGGFVDYGESAEQAAVREALEETGLSVKLTGLLGVYSDPGRDPRFHTLTTVFTAAASGRLKAGDDAALARAFALDELPRPICFDHARILGHYLLYKQGQRAIAPAQHGE